MAIDKESNAYTISFSVIMCVVVGTLLAVAAMALKPLQDKNILNEKMKNILAAIEIKVDHADADKEFPKYIKNGWVLDASGKVISDKDPKKSLEEAMAIDALVEYKDHPEPERKYALFEAEKEGKKLYIMNCVGMGLWAGVWGYVSVGEDFNTVTGASFAHKSETPGLGAEISTPLFTKHFPGKKLLDEQGNFVSIKVVKPGSVPLDEHKVDGISGGTFTSKGVDEMLNRCLKVYSIYFKSLKN